MQEIGRSLVVAGVLLVLVGLALAFGSRIPFLGRLPGDIVWRRGNTTVYFPIVTCLAISAAATVLIWLWSWMRRG